MKNQLLSILFLSILLVTEGCDREDAAPDRPPVLSSIKVKERFTPQHWPNDEYRILYSPMGQVVSVVRKNYHFGSGNDWILNESTIDFSYNTDGLMINAASKNGSRRDFRYNDKKLLIEANDLVNGNLELTVKYGYNEHNQLTSIEHFSYVMYDPLQRFSSKRVFKYSSPNDKNPQEEIFHFGSDPAATYSKYIYEYDDKHSPLDGIHTQCSPIDFEPMLTHNVVKRTKVSEYDGTVIEIARFNIQYNAKDYPVSIQELLEFPYEWSFEPTYYSYE